MIKCVSVTLGSETVYGGPPRKRLEIHTAKILRTVETLEGPQLEVESVGKVAAVFVDHEDVSSVAKTLRMMAGQLEGLL